MTKEYQLSWKLPPYSGLCFTAQEANSTVELTKVGSPSIANTAYSLDGETWVTFTPSNTAGTNVITLANIGDKVYFRNDITNQFDFYIYLQFVMSGKIAASGNINSMYNSVNFKTLTILTHGFCYYRMFENCTSLTTAPELPAKTLSKYCYSGMFNYCSSLTTAPELPATTLAGNCYDSMFSYCTSLTTAPELPVTTLANACYYGMFRGCSALVTATELPATTLTHSCYEGMFNDCTSLTTAPELPATTLAEHCYNSMFRGCSALISAPELSVLELEQHCYYKMFNDCTSLTTAPELPATTLVYCCYTEMFMGCTSLKISDTSGTKIFTRPDSALYTALEDMFTDTGGSFTGTPRAGKTYYYY